MDYYHNDLELSATDLMSLTGHKNLQSIKRYTRMNLKRQAKLLAREHIGTDLQLIIDNAVEYENDSNRHQIVTKEFAVA